VSALSSKFNLPGTSSAFVRRQAITDRIERAASARVVLVRAPAGFGKTSALRQIHDQMEAMDIVTAWVTLDAADNDLARLLSCLAEATVRLHLTDELPADAEAVALLEREGPPFALFLDEFEVLQSPAVLGLIREIIERLPRNGRLVIGSRSLPDLGLGRLRVRGQLQELGEDLLRFSVEETRQFLRLRGLTDLPEAALKNLHTRTEGWIAALLLASMALERNPAAADYIDRLSGSTGAIWEGNPRPYANSSCAPASCAS
jgi:LuxR family maltose regulon positive regulatory protein